MHRFFRNSQSVVRSISEGFSFRPGVRMTILALCMVLMISGFVQAQPATVTITHLEQIGNDLDVQSYGDFYARVTIGGTAVDSFDQKLSYPEDPFVVPLYPSGELLNAPWVLTRDVTGTAGFVDVMIEIIDHDSLTASDRADINPSASEVINLRIDLSTGKWSGDVNWPQNCVQGPNVPDSKSAAICFDVSLLSSSGDADGDGLLDSWEQLGFDGDNDGAVDVDLSQLGASPIRKDLYVEVDCLVAGNHTHCPRQDSIQDVVQSFANAPVPNPDGTTGIQLHVDTGPLYTAGVRISVPGTGGVVGEYGDLNGGGDQIPEAGNEVILSFDAPATETGTSFFDLKRNFYDTRRNLIFRYAIFGHQMTPAFSCFSGNAAIPGRNFMVTLGGTRGSATGPACWVTNISGQSVGSRGEQGGTFMHELGHTLGLYHDGDQEEFNGNEINFKPNYLSVMNYAFQWCNVPTNLATGLTGSCDYSRTRLDPLNETSLDECAGPDHGVYGLAPINWNGGLITGATCTPPNTANVVSDINVDGVCVDPGANGILNTIPAAGSDDIVNDSRIKDDGNRICSTAATGDDVLITAIGATPAQVNELTGFDDWANIKYSVLEVGFAASGAAPVPKEADPETVRETQAYISQMTAPGVVIDKTGPATGRPGDLLAYNTEITNEGRGPALTTLLTDTAPDGMATKYDLGAIKVGDVVTRTSTFLVPADACPGDYTGASASAAFKDFVGKDLTASDSVALEILDVSAPQLTVVMSPATLWPAPNHKLEEVTAIITVIDNCDPNPVITLISVTSSEPETGFLGSGDKGPDIDGADIGTDDRSFFLRAERGTTGHSAGRTYTIIYQTTDASGNTSQATALVTVPRDFSSSQ